jgi:hypothetical protein
VTAGRRQPYRPRATSVGVPPFSFAGPLVPSASPRWYPPASVSTSTATASLDTAGTSTTTVEVRVSGSVVATINLTSGVHLVTVACVATLAPTDYVTMAITTPGVAAANLTVEVF